MAGYNDTRSSGGGASRRAFATIVHKHVDRKIITRDKFGAYHKANLPETMLTNLFSNAIQGDMKAARELLALADEHLEAKPVRENYNYRLTSEVTQFSAEKWAVLGCLPVGCPKDLSKMTVRQMNKAYENWKKRVDELKQTPEGREELKSLGERHFKDKCAISDDELGFMYEKLKVIDSHYRDCAGTVKPSESVSEIPSPLFSSQKDEPSK